MACGVGVGWGGAMGHEIDEVTIQILHKLPSHIYFTF